MSRAVAIAPILRRRLLAPIALVAAAAISVPMPAVAAPTTPSTPSVAAGASSDACQQAIAQAGTGKGTYGH